LQFLPALKELKPCFAEVAVKVYNLVVAEVLVVSL
jgi:hypothetical protein